MFVFILRRLIQALVVMVCVALIAFMLFQYCLLYTSDAADE